MFKFYPRYIAVKLLRFYQKTFSLDHGPLRRLFPFGYCKFHPTCSEYAVQALEKYGFIKGGLKAVWRVLRCNPWSKGGIDSVN